MKWNDDKTITITPPAKPKKITGTRFAAIMGLNKWTSPFNAWCAITRTYNIIGILLLNTRRAVALLTLSKVKPSFLKLYSLIIQDLLYSIVFCFQTPGRAGTLAA